MFWHFYQAPKCGEVYNAGGGRFSNCSILEGIKYCDEITGKKMNFKYVPNNRVGDHIWWISDVNKFKRDYPSWNYKFNIQEILLQNYKYLIKRGKQEHI
jgi:CDP-paratose 2-epimerase